MYKTPEEKAQIALQKEKPREEKPQAKIIVNGKKLDKFYKILNEAKEAIESNDISKAKKLYAQSRELYVGLEYQEKKEVYGELMDLYNRLLK